MKQEGILALIKIGETQEVEFKEGCPSGHKLAEIICGLANTDGGVLILGISAKKEIKGLHCDFDKLQQDIANIRQSIHSSPQVSTSIHAFNDKKIALIEVNKANDKNAHTFNGAVYVRIGSTTHKLEGQALFDFLKNKQILCFDEQESEAKIEDLDERRIENYLIKRSQPDYLKSNNSQEFILSNMFGRGKELNMNDDEVAFYDALEVNDSAVKILGDDALRKIALELTEMIRNSVTIDWTQRESVQAGIRLKVKKILRKYGYPPDKEKNAIETVLKQAELIAKGWVSK